MEEVQGSMLTAEWPLGVLTYTSELTVLGHLDCHQHISACPSPRGRNFWSWIAGGVVRLLQFPVCFFLCHATKYTGSVLFYNFAFILSPLP